MTSMGLMATEEGSFLTSMGRYVDVGRYPVSGQVLTGIHK